MPQFSLTPTVLRKSARLSMKIRSSLYWSDDTILARGNFETFIAPELLKQVDTQQLHDVVMAPVPGHPPPQENVMCNCQ